MNEISFNWFRDFILATEENNYLVSEYVLPFFAAPVLIIQLQNLYIFL